MRLASCTSAAVSGVSTFRIASIVAAFVPPSEVRIATTSRSRTPVSASNSSSIWFGASAATPAS